MPKSKYPDKLDTSVEIPVIRDNITEIGSDVLNSLRSAIFNIEKALGINPQGAMGNTVAARLSNALDENGNILKEALDRSNVLSGPITDADVSKVAAVDESKLRLNYPTQLLQDEIVILDNKIELFILTLQELNAIVSAHVHPDATNRHHALAITVDSAEVEESSVAALSLNEGDLQEVLEEIYNAHINYTGEGIEENNNSHKALQIYYNNEDVPDIIPSSDVQGALDDLANIQALGVRSSNLNFNSNGIIRTGSVYDDFEGSEVGTELVEASIITHNAPSGLSKMTISFSDNPIPIGNIKPFDIFTILDSPEEDDNREYLISSVELTGSGNLDSVEIFDGPKNIGEVGTTAKITRNIYVNYNENGLNCAVRPRYLKSNTPDIQAALPNAATVISSGIRTNNIIEGSSDVLSLEIDGGDAIEINIFDSDFDNQTIDTVVFKINEHIVANNLNIFAYKIRSLRCFELAITHILPNFAEDLKNRTIKIVEASSNDASAVLGMAYLLDREVEGSYSNIYHINGKLLEDFGQIQKYTSDFMSISSGTTNLDAVSTTDFIVDGIRTGDLCVIEGSSESDDDGTYRIHSMTSEVLTLDSSGSTLSGELSEGSAVFIIRCTAPIGEMEFEEIDGLILVDVFVDEYKGIFYKRRLDMVGNLLSGSFYAVVSDVTRGFIGQDDVYTLGVDISGMATLTQEPGGVPGEEVFVGATGVYKVFSTDKMAYVVLEVFATGTPSALITCTLNGYTEMPDSVLHLCRAVYSTKLGFVLGSATSAEGVPKVIDKRTTGTTDDTIISEPLLERYIQGPRNELRGSGVIRATSIKSIVDNADGTCSVSVNPGVLVVNGVRFEYLGVDDLLYKYGDNETDLHNFYIALDGFGCLIIGNEVDPAGGTDYISPFSGQVVAHLSYVEPTGDGSDPPLTDLRLFVDHLDYKVIADITVANDQRFGHFTDIKAAVDYARMFTKMFPKMGIPSICIKEGKHYIFESIKIDFDLCIQGVGPSTILMRDDEFLLDEDNGQESSVFFIGSGTPTDMTTFVSSEYIINGITIKDLTYEQSDVFTSGRGCFVEIAQQIDPASSDSLHAIFRFSNINFVGKDLGGDRDVSGGAWTRADAEPWEFAIRVGEDAGNFYGNLLISNCYFNYMGYGDGPVYLDGGNTHTNVVITNNIATNVSDDATGSYGILSEYSISNATLVRYIEANNVSDGT